MKSVLFGSQGKLWELGIFRTHNPLVPGSTPGRPTRLKKDLGANLSPFAFLAVYCYGFTLPEWRRAQQ